MLDLHEVCKADVRLTGVCGRDIASRIEENGNVDVADPAVGIAAVNEIDDSSNNRLDS